MREKGTAPKSWQIQLGGSVGLFCGGGVLRKSGRAEVGSAHITLSVDLKARERARAVARIEGEVFGKVSGWGT